MAPSQGFSNAPLEVVIPVYNEGDTVNNVYESLRSALGEDIDWKAYFIYDYEADPTVPFLKTLEQKDQRVLPVMQTFGRGVINALKFGFSLCHDGPVVVVMGDDSDDLSNLRQMIEKFREGATIVASSRHSAQGHYEGGNWIKKTLSYIAGRLLFAMGVNTTDPTNNYKLYSGRFLKQVEIESRGGFELALELTVKAAALGYKIDEVPGQWKDRVQGESKFQLWAWMPHYMKWFVFGVFYCSFSAPAKRRILVQKG